MGNRCHQHAQAFVLVVLLLVNGPTKIEQQQNTAPFFHRIHRYFGESADGLQFLLASAARVSLMEARRPELVLQAEVDAMLTSTLTSSPLPLTVMQFSEDVNEEEEEGATEWDAEEDKTTSEKSSVGNESRDQNDVDKVQGPLPFVVLHGIGDQCSNPGMKAFVRFLSKMSGATGVCIEIGNGAFDSWLMRLDHQTKSVCDQVLSIPQLSKGFSIVGLSQGALIGRAVVEFCDTLPPVRNFISIGGPHAGVASTPECKTRPLCSFIDSIIRLGVYSPIVQNAIAPTGYVKIPNDLAAYYKGCTYLPYVNNEILEKKNETFADRFASINQLLLIKFLEDTVLFPPETAHFGFFDTNFSKILPVQQTDLFLEDRVGLRRLDEAGRVTYLSVPGNHLQISKKTIVDEIVPLLR